jgi:signal transduction histidine kinase
MNVFSSLTNRIFVASALLAVLAIGVAVYRVNVAVTAQAENELQRGLQEAGTLLEEYRSTLFAHFARETRLIADLPKLKAALDSNTDPDTARPLVEEYQRLIGSDLFVVTNPSGQVIAEAGRLQMPRGSAAAEQAIRQATQGHEAIALWPVRGGVIQVVSVPSVIGGQLLGTVSAGFSLDEQAAARFKALTNSEIAFAVDGRIQASTLPRSFDGTLAPLAGTQGVRSVRLGDSDYVVTSRRLPIASVSGGTDGAARDSSVPTALILRSRTERLRFLNSVHRELAGTAFLAVLAATLISYAVARTVTRPLGTITATMREMAATGDLTKKITLSPGGRWEDEDARLLATTFNTMTESIARFQRDAAQRERLSSLGRLSTVVAHEIRNPLMIIKTALRSLKQEPAPSARVEAAVADIEEEVARLNRIVSEVLDFARPIKFDFGTVELNALCQDAMRAAKADGSTVVFEAELQRDAGEIVTDAERLRLALVNVLTNAKHAVLGAPATPVRRDRKVRLVTRRNDSTRVAVEVHDDGAGIAAEDLARVFDPFFTTRKTGTGLGLAITRNIIEGLGGNVAVTSRPGEGTTVRIDLPIRAGG